MNETQLVMRRSELLAELFLQQLNPSFVAKNTDLQDVGVDFFVGFKNPLGGTNLVAVEVKSTEHPVNSYKLSKKTHNLLANSNIPGILLVVDVKQNRFFCSELGPRKLPSTQKFVSIELMEVHDGERRNLTERMSRLPQCLRPGDDDLDH